MKNAIIGMTAAAFLMAGMDARGQEAEVAIATEIADRQPVGEGTNFPPTVGQLVAWTRVSGGANSTIEHVWRHEDHEEVIPLAIGNGSPWRTWSRRTIPGTWTGEWRLEVRAGGAVIAQTTFTVGENLD